MGLKRIGVDKVWVLEGGLKAWREHGLPVSQSPEVLEAVAERLGVKLSAPAASELRPYRCTIRNINDFRNFPRYDGGELNTAYQRPVAATELLRQYGCGPIPFVGTENAFYDRHLVFDRVIDPLAATARERFEAFARSVRDVLAQRWVLTKKTYERENPKRIYYLSMEFLIGRSAANNVINLLLDPLVQHAADEQGIDWHTLIEEEPDAGLGNGGLGRLAACFLDSMATMQLPATGYGLRYEYGMFKQSIVNGWQMENADNWLRESDPWEIARPTEKVEVKLNCSVQVRGGQFEVNLDRPSSLHGIPFDRPVVGYGGRTVNTLRLWAAAAPDYFDFQEFGSGDFIGALGETLEAESLTRVLYPDDSTTMGRRLRFVQEYFLVACSVADIVRRFRRLHNDWDRMPEKVAIQMNDTHPAIAVAELMRVLLDDAHLGWDEAWSLTRRTLAYTNHTLLPEALEKWPVEGFEVLVPRQLEIIHEINRGLLEDVRKRFPGDEGRVERMSLVEEGPEQKIRMANLAIVGSHSTNGVAAVHSKLLRTSTVKDFAEMFPERFNNKTNGVTPRRWLLLANPGLASVITGAIGDRVDYRPPRALEVEAAGRRSRIPRRISGVEGTGQIAVCELAQSYVGANCGPANGIRLPGKANSRIQETITECTADYRRVQPAAQQPEPGRGSTDILLCRQSGPGVPVGEADHQVHQQPGRDDRFRPGYSRPHQHRLSSRIQRFAGREVDSRERCLQPDLHGGL